MGTNQTGDRALPNQLYGVSIFDGAAGNELFGNVVSGNTGHGIVLDGTGSPTQIPGYRVAGKTSTAQKFDNEAGAYGGYVAGFGGFLPVSDPRVVIFVAIDEPRVGSRGGHHGGSAAGPVFRSVAEAAIRILRIAPDAVDAQPTVVADAPGKQPQQTSPLS